MKYIHQPTDFSMASALTSNSFLQTAIAAASPNSRTNKPKNQRQLVFAKKAAGPEDDGPNICFDFGKWADVKALVPAVIADQSSSPGLSFGRRKDPGTVFVAGATGQAGVRFAQTLLCQGFSVRASVPDLVAAQELARLAATYKVTRSQIASLVGDVFSNTAVAENKAVEVFTDASAPSKAFDELFSAIPEDNRRKAYAEALAKAKTEEEAVRASEEASGQEVEKPEQEEARGASSMATEAQKKAEASVESLLSKAKGVSLSWENLSSQLKSAVQKTSEEPKVRVATVRGQAKARSLPSLKAVVKNPRPGSSKPKAKSEEPKRETRKVFGG